jgi:hypothetical protein
MSTPTQATVNAEALASKIALKDAANAAWILAADAIVQEMQARGLFSVELPVPAPASMKDLSDYYRALGYGWYYGRCDSWGDFGEWPGVWSYPYTSESYLSLMYVCRCKQVCTAILSWKNNI